MYSEYSGGPKGDRDLLIQLVSPHGGTMADGVRLATINGIGLIVGSSIVFLSSLVLRALDLPYILVSFGICVVFIAAAVFFWFQYAQAYGRAARASQRSVRPDIFGVIASIPFAVVGLLLIASGLFGLFWAMVTFSMSRAGDGLQRLLFAIIFLGLALANVIIARAASD